MQEISLYEMLFAFLDDDFFGDALFDLAVVDFETLVDFDMV